MMTGRWISGAPTRSRSSPAGCAAAPDFPTQHGRRRELGVLIDADTLAGRAAHPGELVGIGPVPAELALEWAADAAWRRWTTDPVSGYLLDYGQTVYNPPQALRDYVLARDAVSRFPTSSTPAHRSHLDHAIPFSQGGPTASANISALAGHPHRAKHEAGWHLTLHPDGIADWTSPASKSYRTEPAQYNWMRPAPGDPRPSGRRDAEPPSDQPPTRTPHPAPLIVSASVVTESDSDPPPF